MLVGVYSFAMSRVPPVSAHVPVVPASAPHRSDGLLRDARSQHATPDDGDAGAKRVADDAAERDSHGVFGGRQRDGRDLPKAAHAMRIRTHARTVRNQSHP